jgi:hypothetical protein
MLFLCPICTEEFNQSALTACPTCDCSLVAASIETRGDLVSFEIPSDQTRVEYVELCRPPNYALGMLVKQMLEQNHVAALLKGGNSVSVLPQLAFGGQLIVLVDASRIEYAKELYSAYFESEEDVDYIED